MNYQPFFMIILVLILAAGSILWHYSRSASLLRKWSEDNGFRLVSSEYRNYFRGPYFWTTSKGQTVYRVTVQDKPGRLRTGWVRCGGWWLGLMSNHVETCWDETPSQGVAVPRDRWLDD
jgi:hypothetical protein